LTQFVEGMRRVNVEDQLVKLRLEEIVALRNPIAG